MNHARLSALAAALAMTATSAFGGECCRGNSGAAGVIAPVVQGGYGLPGGYANRLGNPYFYTGAGAGYGVAPQAVAVPQAGVGVAPYGGAVGLGVGSAAAGGDVYSTHFGPGFHRNQQFGHYRFPYYSYRRPWYHVGPPAYAADTNFPW